MLDELIEYYNKELGNYKLVFQYMKYQYWAFILSLITWSATVSTAFYFLVMHALHRAQWYHTWYFFLSWALVVIPATAFIFFNQKAGTIVKSYGRSVGRFAWLTNDFYKYKREQLKDYFLERNLQEDKLKALLPHLNKLAEQQKFKGWVGIGILVALLTPIWSHFVQVLLNLIPTLKGKITILAIAVAFIVTFAYILNSIRQTFIEYYERKYWRTRNLIDAIEHIILESLLKDSN